MSPKHDARLPRSSPKHDPRLPQMLPDSHVRLLIVAGHDPSGGAGVDADREAVGDLPVESLCVVTAFTDQDDRAVRSLGARAADAWRREASEAARAGIAAVKFGLLPGADHVHAAAELVRELRASHDARLPAVVDPVLRSSSGTRFVDAAGVEALRGALIPAGVILTPNLPEAAELACQPLAPMIGTRRTGAQPGMENRAGVEPLMQSRAGAHSSMQARLECARILLALGASAVVIKGGHGAEDPVRDLVALPDGRHSWHEHPRVACGKLRGSGCRFASRLAAGLALGRSLEESVADAGLHVAARMRSSPAPRA